MSLIDEALKRARMEAAQQAAESEGLPYPAIPRHLARRRRRAWLAPAAAALAVAGGLGIGWWVASGRPRTDSLAALGGGAAGSDAAPVASGPATPAPVTRDAVPDVPEAGEWPSSAASAPGSAREAPPASEPQPAGPRSRTSGPARAEAVARDSRVPEPQAPPAAPSRPAAGRPAAEAPRPADRPTPPPADHPARPPALAASPTEPLAAAAAEPAGAEDQSSRPLGEPSVAITDPDSGVLLELPNRQSQAESEVTEVDGDPPVEIPVESHAGQLPLPDGGAIELAGIAWSETGPFALINGRVVSPGATIEGYSLEQIRPGHVILAGAGRRIHLSLR